MKVLGVVRDYDFYLKDDSPNDKQSRLSIFARKNRSVTTVAIKSLPPKLNIINRLKVFFLTAFSWKWVKGESNILINVNSLAKRTGLTPKEIKNASRDKSLFNAITHKLDERALEASSRSRAKDIKAQIAEGLPVDVHGKGHWEKLGIKVGEVPPPPQELLAALKEPCPIAKDGSKMSDTHVVFWMPAKVDDKTISVNDLAKKLKGDYLIGLDHEAAADLNKPVEGGYWMALYYTPVSFLVESPAPGWSFENQKKYIEENYPGYQVPLVQDVISATSMWYAWSEHDKAQRSPESLKAQLGSKKLACYVRCEEKFSQGHVVLNISTSAPTVALLYSATNRSLVEILPVRKFI